MAYSWLLTTVYLGYIFAYRQSCSYLNYVLGSPNKHLQFILDCKLCFLVPIIIISDTLFLLVRLVICHSNFIVIMSSVINFGCFLFGRNIFARPTYKTVPKTFVGNIYYCFTYYIFT